MKKKKSVARATASHTATQAVRFAKAREQIANDDHDGPLVLVLWNRREAVGVGLDVANTEDDANELADQYMSLLDSRAFEIRVVALSFDEDEGGTDDEDESDEDEEDSDDEDGQQDLFGGTEV